MYSTTQEQRVDPDIVTPFYRFVDRSMKTITERYGGRAVQGIILATCSMVSFGSRISISWRLSKRRDLVGRFPLACNYWGSG